MTASPPFLAPPISILCSLSSAGCSPLLPLHLRAPTPRLPVAWRALLNTSCIWTPPSGLRSQQPLSLRRCRSLWLEGTSSLGCLVSSWLISSHLTSLNWEDFPRLPPSLPRPPPRGSAQTPPNTWSAPQSLLHPVRPLLPPHPPGAGRPGHLKNNSEKERGVWNEGGLGSRTRSIPSYLSPAASPSLSRLPASQRGITLRLLGGFARRCMRGDRPVTLTQIR